MIAIYSQQKQTNKHKIRLKADCGSDHQIFIEKFRFKLKKVEKTTMLFRYDLNQIPYNHMVEMTNRFKGLALKTECLNSMDGGFMTLYMR